MDSPTVPLDGKAALTRSSLPPPLSVKLTATLTVFPTSSPVSLYVFKSVPMSASKVVPSAS